MKAIFNPLSSLLKLMVKVFFELPMVKPSFEKRLKDKYIQKTVSLYRGEGFTEFFAKVRFWDAPLEEFEKLVPKSGKIIDLGCGDGILTNYLAVSSTKRKLFGMEINKERIDLAYKGLPNTEFKYGDALRSNFPKCDAFIINHVFHHLPSFDSQIEVIKKCAKVLDKGGQLIVAEVDKGASLRYVLGWVTDTIIFPTLFERQIFNPKVFHRSAKEWRAILTSLGFSVSLKRPKHLGPFPDIFLIATKR